MNRSTVQIEVGGDGVWELEFDVDRSPEGYGPWPIFWLHNGLLERPPARVACDLAALAWDVVHRGSRTYSESDYE